MMSSIVLENFISSISILSCRGQCTLVQAFVMCIDDLYDSSATFFSEGGGDLRFYRSCPRVSVRTTVRVTVPECDDGYGVVLGAWTAR